MHEILSNLLDFISAVEIREEERDCGYYTRATGDHVCGQYNWFPHERTLSGC
jgi:hypothetical protein